MFNAQCTYSMPAKKIFFEINLISKSGNHLFSFYTFLNMELESSAFGDSFQITFTTYKKRTNSRAKPNRFFSIRFCIYFLILLFVIVGCISLYCLYKIQFPISSSTTTATTTSTTIPTARPTTTAAPETSMNEIWNPTKC